MTGGTLGRWEIEREGDGSAKVPFVSQAAGRRVESFFGGLRLRFFSRDRRSQI